MRRFHRILIVFAILLSGLALVPFVAFPQERISWQRYSSAYGDEYKIYLPIIIHQPSSP
jgi:hypothetical protein